MPSYKKTPSAMRECVGPECGGCASANCYAEGGSVSSWTKREDNEKGVHHKYLNKEGESAAGKHVRSGINSPAHDEGYSVRSAKREHEKVLGEMRGMKRPNLYAGGGEVDDDPSEHTRAISRAQERETLASSRLRQHADTINHKASWWEDQKYKDLASEHKSAVRDRQKTMRGAKGALNGYKAKGYADGGEVHDDVPEPDPKNARDMQKGATSGGTSASEAWKNLKSGLGFAEGGEVDEHSEPDGDEGMGDELKQIMGDELMSALERKDKKAIMSSLEAIVLSCRGRE